MGNFTFFLDSGAFSADSQGKPIELSEYISFIKEHEDVIDIYPVLDVIGNETATWENQKIMEDAGLTPMPVFHVEDSIKYLHRCLDYDYFCLGGMAGGASHQSRQHFLNTCFDIICDTPDRKPKCKVHGFGLAAPSLMVAYPFYSIDTSSWVAYSQYGIILLPQKKKDGIPDYGKTPIKLFVTERSPKTHMEGQHIKNLTKPERLEVINYLSDLGFQLGKSYTFEADPEYELQDTELFINKEKTLVERVVISGVSNNNSLRYALNMNYFQNIANSCPEWPWSWSPKIRSFF
jgi:hypothetical protein